MKLEDCTALVEPCIHDTPSPCSCACPFGLDLRSFLKKVSKGRWSGAWRELRTATVFPTVAAAFCPRPCEGKCQRSLLGDEAVAIGELERALLRLCKPQAPDAFPIPGKEQSVAVVGAGVAGLSLALSMAQKKYAVTVFDRQNGWGGALRTHPDFAVFNADFTLQFSAETVTFRFDTQVTSLEELSGFNGIYIATGDGGNTFDLRSGWDSSLNSTTRPGVFLGGGAVGMAMMESIAAGREVSRVMEGALQTGRAEAAGPAKRCHSHSLVPTGAQSSPRVVPADGGIGYTMEEAKAEAGRCFQCNCDGCMTRCELMEHYHRAPHQSAMEVFADSSPHFLASRTMTRQTYSCNECGWCSQICPEQVDLSSLFDLSRHARREQNIHPAAFHDFWLRELEFASTEAFYAAPPKGHKTCTYAFFPGCQLPASLPEHTVKAMNLLGDTLNTGILLGCCGAPAVWAGEQDLEQATVGRLRSAWERLGKPALILACATCGKMLTRLLPEIPTVSLYTLLAENTALSLAPLFPAAGVFDPCSAREDTAAQSAVRTLARRGGTELEELPEPGRCCGYGGHMRTANPKLYETVVSHRSTESDAPYVVYCANCREVFLQQGKACAHILESLFGPGGELPTLEQKRQNSLWVKGNLMQAMEHTAFTPTAQPWDNLLLDVPDAVRTEMEQALITDFDVKQCIYCAEENNDYFLSENGLRLSSLIRKVLTYWVEYTPGEEGRYTVHAAYCHRMRFGKENEA